MSKIQRYSTVRYQNGEVASFGPHRAGEFVRYADFIAIQARRILVASLIGVLCGFAAGYFSFHKYDPQPVAQATMEQRHSNENLARLHADLEQKEAALEKARVIGRHAEQADKQLQGAYKHIANLEAQIQANNRLLSPAQQTENLKLAASTMHDADIQDLALEVGFSKIRVKE